ncbi:MAG: EscU/YscU/HrcU family type III secretion system export apparatus switch protein [Treponema sp.]|jgi:flagellar biosynthesis protein|nr:EscU/YscU/HrcU family type III secretion system export apparatus switch protein [Treponema sp.]
MKNEKKAVALKYPEGAAAPLLVASGKGRLAEKMLEIAEREKIPMVKNAELADFLTLQELGSVIPQETWEIVAKIFAFFVDLKKS